MKNVDIGNYMMKLLATDHLDEEMSKEVPIIINLLSVYMSGLMQEDFPMENLYRLMDMEQDIPVQFHTLVAQASILKSKKFDHITTLGYLEKNVEKLLKEFKNYFIYQKPKQ